MDYSLVHKSQSTICKVLKLKILNELNYTVYKTIISSAKAYKSDALSCIVWTSLVKVLCYPIITASTGWSPSSHREALLKYSSVMLGGKKKDVKYDRYYVTESVLSMSWCMNAVQSQF